MSERRLPWHNEPHVDTAAATQRALKAAQKPRTAINAAAVKAYAAKAFSAEIDALRSTAKGGRNHQLFKSAASLFEIIAGGAPLSESDVTAALHEACRHNGHEQDDGHETVAATIASGRRKGCDNPRDLSHVGINGYEFDSTPTKKMMLDTVFDMEQDFWKSRDSLTIIYLGSLARLCAPWAVLGYCAARALALVRPHCVLPPLVGGVGSLNWFGAITARSGGGKTSAKSVARDLVNEPILERNPGSGEGLTDQYIKPANKETGEPKGLHESIMFVADEADNFAAVTSRTGSTLLPTLRSAFSGDTLGFGYRKNSPHSDQHLQPHTYRLTLMVNLQPRRAGVLMDDEDGGTLQRFMWFPAIDPRISSERPDMPAPLILPAHTEWRYPREIVIPYEASQLITDERVRNARGQTDALDGHALFIREKFAFALAVLDGRVEMTLEDWRLAGIASRISDHTRAWVRTQLDDAEVEEATKRGTLIGVSQSAADDKKSLIVDERRQQVRQWILSKLDEAPMTTRELSRAVSSKNRSYLLGALEQLEAMGRVDSIEEKKDTGPAGKKWVKTVV